VLLYSWRNIKKDWNGNLQVGERGRL